MGLDLSMYAPDDVEKRMYHSGRPSRISQVPLEEREFIAWDGEGINLDGPNFPQSYTLFGCSTGEYVSSDTHLNTFRLLDFIISIGEKHPSAYHVGFAFNYDANMLLRSLSERNIRRIHESGSITLTRPGTNHRFYIHFIPGKWFQVTRKGIKHGNKNPTDKITVRIYDLFSFFGCSFIKAYKDLVGEIPTIVREGKANRNNFATLTADYVQTYWAAEIAMLRELAEALRSRLYGAGLRINQWHGPGALASYTLKRHSIKTHMAEAPKKVREAAAYAYAGGRFEMFRLGRTIGPIYSMDINSAYPYGIMQLPSLSAGQWNWVERPTRIAKFGVYRVRLLPRPGGTFLERAPGPLFHRDKMGNISFPWVTEGWYWSPEVRNLSRLKSERYEIVEGWEYVGYSDAKRPFAFVQQDYDLRQEWKRAGNSSQLALKLMLNSLYGKMAQRVGWNEVSRTAPTWHQLEWAGWATSNCRAMLWEVMSRIPYSDLLAVETDGLYTTRDPASLGIRGSSDLGGWEVEVYDEILYVQSGMAWLRKGDCPDDCRHDRDIASGGEMDSRCAWSCKRRGLDARTFSLDACRDYLRTLGPEQQWQPYRGTTTRFVGMGAALAGNAPFKVRHCVWQTVDRDISPGQGGKRIHVHKQCVACSQGLSAWDTTHDMSIRSLAYSDPISKAHDIPWESDDTSVYQWREYEEREQGLVK